MAKGDSERIKKQIHSMTVYKTEEVEREETQEEDGKEIVVKKVSKEKVPYTVVLLKPTRRQDEEADLEYSIEMSNCVKAGILTKAMLQKKYSDTGGLLSDEDALRLQTLYAQYRSKSIDFIELESKSKRTKKQQERYDSLEGEITSIKREIIDLEMSFSSLFSHTADTKAQNRVIVWYMLNLSHIFKEEELEEEIELKPLFPGETFEQKRDAYYQLEESGNDEIFEQIKSKLPAITSLWYLSQSQPSKEDFENLASSVDEELSQENSQ